MFTQLAREMKLAPRLLTQALTLKLFKWCSQIMKLSKNHNSKCMNKQILCMKQNHLLLLHPPIIFKASLICTRKTGIIIRLLIWMDHIIKQVRISINQVRVSNMYILKRRILMLFKEKERLNLKENLTLLIQKSEAIKQWLLLKTLVMSKYIRLNLLHLREEEHISSRALTR